MHHLRTVVLLVVLAIIGTSAFFIACEDDTGEESRQQSTDTRHEGQAAAVILHGEVQKVNYPAYEALVEYGNRTDLANHPWYIYVLGDNGNVLGYYVATTKPINSCTYLSSSEDIDSSSQGRVIITAPSLDGTYSGDSACTAEFFFDAATGAMIEINQKRFVSDQPLLLDAEPITVDAAPLPVDTVPAE